jgi:hypothetical protein
MLTVISLYVIDKIFSGTNGKLSTKAKMLYINCLTYHFREMEPTVSNAIAFNLKNVNIPNYEKHQPAFVELFKNDLVELSNDRVYFNNLWGKHIDWRQLKKQSPEEYVAGFTFSSATSFKEEMLSSTKMKELQMMRYKISEVQIDALISLFTQEQDTFEKKYNSFGECVKHFTYWIKNNIVKVPIGTVVKSKGRILGLS